MGLTRGGRLQRSVGALSTPVTPLILGQLGFAVALFVGVLHVNVGHQLQHTPADRFVLAVAAFAAAEAIVLHVELGRNAHSISVAEIALSVTLFFLPPLGIVLARILGGGAVLIAVRRQRPVKAMFNASIWMLDVAAACAVFHALHGGVGLGAERLVVPAVGAALVAATVDSLGVNVVIAVTSGEMRASFALRFLVTCLLGAFTSALLGAVCVVAIAYSPWLLVPIVIVTAALMVGIREFAVLNRRHSGVKALYEFSDSMSRMNGGLPPTQIVVGRIMEVMRVDFAALWIESADGLRYEVTAVHRDGAPSEHSVARDDAPAVITEVAASSQPLLVTDVGDHGPGGFWAGDRPSDAVLASVDGQQGIRGALVIADRLGDVATLGRDDMRLLQTLASHAGTALANVRLMRQLDHDSTHDGLTGLWNRTAFQHRLDEILAANGLAGVLLMDLDRFKEINDTLGHHFGDLLLQQVAARLSEELDDGVLARLGGDEFAVALSGHGCLALEDLARRLRARLAEPLRLESFDITVDASVGIALADVAAEFGHVTSSRLLRCADIAMYAAKRSGRGVHVYQVDLDAHSPRKLAIAGGLLAAISNDELSLRYQPQVRLSDGALVGCEALVRWEHPTYGEVTPDEFVSVAEQTGQIRELTRHVLELAVTQLAAWHREGRTIGVSVNISVRNLLEADLPSIISALITEHGVPSGRLTLEVTESQLMADPARTLAVLGQLDRIGVRIAVDDFGTGYSSLAYLKQMPVAEVKIDKTFVRDIAGDGNDAAIIEAIIQLAHTLGVEVVAEGVEDHVAESHLNRLGCDLVQGFYVGRPMRAEQLPQWVELRRLSQPQAIVDMVPDQRRPEIEQVASL